MQSLAALLSLLLTLALSSPGRAQERAPLWSDTYGGNVQGQATDVEISRGTAVVTSLWSGVVPRFAFGFHVRAYDARRGVLLWEDLVNDGLINIANEVTIHQGRAYAVGMTEREFVQGFALRAYDVDGGALAWEDWVPGGQALTVGAGNRTVVAAGQMGAEFAVRAYDARSGAFLWSDLQGDTNRTEYATSVAMGGSVAVVAGFLRGDDQDSAFTVRSHDSRTGALLWRDETEPGRFGIAYEVATRGRTVVAVGTIGCGFGVRAYSLATGTVLWEDVEPGPPDPSVDPCDEARSVALKGNRAIVAGHRGDEAIVRSYELASGRRVWSHSYEGAVAPVVAIGGGGW